MVVPKVWSQDGLQCYPWLCEKCDTHRLCDVDTNNTCSCIKAIPKDGQYYQSLHHQREYYNHTLSQVLTSKFMFWTLLKTFYLNKKNKSTWFVIMFSLNASEWLSFATVYPLYVYGYVCYVTSVSPSRDVFLYFFSYLMNTSFRGSAWTLTLHNQQLFVCVYRTHSMSSDNNTISR